MLYEYLKNLKEARMFHEYFRNLKMRIIFQKTFQPIVAHFSVIQQCTKKPKAKKISVELGTRVINGDSHHHLATRAFWSCQAQWKI